MSLDTDAILDLYRPLLHRAFNMLLAEAHRQGRIK